MSEENDKLLYELHAEICSTMANPTRLEIINLLRDGEKWVGYLAESAGTSQANMSQHLTVLRRQAIVETRRAGATVYYQLSNPKMLKAFDILREILFEQLESEQKLMNRLKTVTGKKWKRRKEYLWNLR